MTDQSGEPANMDLAKRVPAIQWLSSNATWLLVVIGGVASIAAVVDVLPKSADSSRDSVVTGLQINHSGNGDQILGHKTVNHWRLNVPATDDGSDSVSAEHIDRISINTDSFVPSDPKESHTSTESVEAPNDPVIRDDQEALTVQSTRPAGVSGSGYRYEQRIRDIPSIAPLPETDVVNSR